MNRLLSLAFLLTAVLVPSVQGQQARYAPTFRNPRGSELVLMYISSSTCMGNRSRGIHEAVEQAKIHLAARAQAEGRTFRAIGVALDWQPDSGLAYLREFGQFDELVVGSTFFNLGATDLIWGDSTSRATIPQLILYERTVDPSNPRRIRLGRPHVLDTVVGGDSIVARVASGFGVR